MMLVAYSVLPAPEHRIPSIELPTKLSVRSIRAVSVTFQVAASVCCKAFLSFILRSIDQDIAILGVVKGTNAHRHDPQTACASPCRGG
jgi:hypothetical protein